MRQRLLKSLRIAVTAVSLVVCGLLIVLWVRSYTHPVECGGPLFGTAFRGYTYDGIAHVVIHHGGTVPIQEWKSFSLPDDHVEFLLKEGGNWLWNLPKNDPVMIGAFSAPYRFMFIVTATIAALPWIKWRFSLRTLLIVITALALFFGAIAMSL